MFSKWRSSLLALLLVGFTACGSEEDEGAESTDLPEILDGLGVNQALGQPKGWDGEPLSDDYNPLGTRQSFLNRQAEIYLAGVAPLGATARSTLFDDVLAGSGVLHTENGVEENHYADSPKVTTSGDFDGDGREEIAALVMDNGMMKPGFITAYLRIIEDEGEGYAVTERIVNSQEPAWLANKFESYNDYLVNLDIGAADLDGDNKDEIFLIWGDELWVLDDAETEYETVYNQHFPFNFPNSRQVVRVAGGDLNGDDRAELVTVMGSYTFVGDDNAEGEAHYTIYEMVAVPAGGWALQAKHFGALEQAKLLDDPEDWTPAWNYMTADISIGDVDGDRIGEIVIAGLISGNGQIQLNIQVMEFVEEHEQYELKPLRGRMTFMFSDHGNFLPLVPVRTGDFDGDGADEIFLQSYFFDDTNHLTDVGGGPAQWLTHLGETTEISFMGNFIAVGDVNGDLRDDLIQLSRFGDDLWLYAYELQPPSTSGSCSVEALWRTDLEDSAPHKYSVTTVNSDVDGVFVKFLKRELLFTQPNVIAVVAAPPYYEGVNTDLVGAGTTFGQETTTAEGREESIGFSVGLTVGVEVDVLVASVSVKDTVTMSMDLLTSRSSQVTESFSYVGGAKTDKMVFSTVPFDVYSYEVLWAAGDQAAVGSIITLNVPRRPQTLFVDVAFFNENNGCLFDIDETLLTHTIGDPHSYPTSSPVTQRSAELDGGFFSSRTMTVGQGAGYQTILISRSESEGEGRAFDLENKVVAEVKAGAAVAGVTGGFHGGYTTHVTTTDTAFFQGRVGNILDAGDFTSKSFDFGLYAKPMEMEGQYFPLIGYWVQ